jgi:hypothetical protein
MAWLLVHVAFETSVTINQWTRGKHVLQITVGITDMLMLYALTEFHIPVIIR